MENNTLPLAGKVALITGAARRVGAVIARLLHSEGMNLVLHYHTSHEEARALQKELNDVRENSVVLVQTDLLNTAKLTSLVKNAEKSWGRIDTLINNASSFYSTPFNTVTEEQWEDLLGTNLKAPYFLCQAAAKSLVLHQGSIVNIVDVHAERPLKAYSAYSIAKAGLVMLTKALARELGPKVRVNAVAPGVILWPETGMDDVTKQRIISRTALKREGSPNDVARAVLFLIRDANYSSGEILRVDGGRGLTN